MKTGRKFALFAAAFCILAAVAGFGYYFIYDGGSSGHFAFAVELRMVAYDAADKAPGFKGPFIFQDADAREFIDTGDAPDGWKWVPVADFAQNDVLVSTPISRTSNGQVFLLVGDSRELAVVLTDPVSVKLEKSSGVSPVPILKIRIGRGDAEVLSKFREVHGDDEVAVVIDGRICGTAGTFDLDRVIEIWFPHGGENVAKHLRDTLLSKKI
jgi:hypothetical protein